MLRRRGPVVAGLLIGNFLLEPQRGEVFGSHDSANKGPGVRGLDSRWNVVAPLFEHRSRIAPHLQFGF